MIFIKNGSEYPRYIGDVESDSPGWSLGQALPEGWSVVQETDQPEAPSGSVVRETSPSLVDGVWTQSWEIVALSEAELSGLATSQEAASKKFLPASTQL